MPKKIQNFARSALVKPITINVGRAGAANMNVIQEMEYVNQEAKIAFLLSALKRHSRLYCYLLKRNRMSMPSMDICCWKASKLLLFTEEKAGKRDRGPSTLSDKESRTCW